jgi:L-seryl-tRNA(Ser) seleniumtransferase
VLEDLGSGMLMDLSAAGLPQEPTVRETVAAGVDIITFSGDKLLGGPQAGLMVGRRDAIERIRKHPMARALRSDKLTLAALEATLQPYLDPQRALREIPVLRMLQSDPDQLKSRCESLAAALLKELGERVLPEIVAENSMVGGGALPLAELPGYAVAISSDRISADQLASRLRASDLPVIGRIQEGRLLLNPRTVLPEQDQQLVAVIIAALNNNF